MDSQLATVLTSGSLNVQNGSQCTETSGPLAEDCLDPKGGETPPCTVPGNVQPCPVQIALTIRQDSLSVNGKKPEAGGTPKPASQETRKIGGFREPITVKTGVPVLRREPIRIRIVVPPQCKRPITNATISLTKDFALSPLKSPAVGSAGAVSPVQNTSKGQMCDAKKEADHNEVTSEVKSEAEPTHCADAETREDVWQNKTIHVNVSEAPFITGTNAVKILSQQEIKKEYSEGELRKNITLIWKKMQLNGSKLNDVEMEEQTEPLDLSLPKNRESRERRCGRLLDDCGCDSSLIMEVDEYEGEGDRDIVEEDDNDGEVFRIRDSHLSPSFLPSSVFDPLSPIDCSAEDLLLIDDQGIPYTLSPDGLKLPQVDVSTLEQTEHASSGVEDGQVPAEAGPSLSQSLDDALDAPSDEPAPVTSPSLAPQLVPNSDTCEEAESGAHSFQESNAALSQQASGISVASQPIQILTNPTNNMPILFLSSSSSSPQGPVSLSLPLSQASTSTPMLLLLSPVPSSSGETTSTSTPIAVLDPSTGQVSQITTTSAPLGQVATLGSPLPSLISLSPSNPPVILSGCGVVSSLGVKDSSIALQTDQNSSTAHNMKLTHNPICSSESKPGNEAIFAEEVSTENKPFTACSPHTQPATLTFDPSSQPCSEADIQSPSSESRLDSSDPHSQYLPLKDHLYYNCAPPPSPPLMTSTKLEPFDQLDPLSPDWTPDGMTSRRVLYCQLCPRVFFYLSDLERHAITHSQKKPHVCQQCGKAFKRSSHLQRHKHIHTGQRNFVCPICAKRFREAGELQRHQRVHTGEKPYQCQLCHTRFAERNTLRRHTKRKHPYHQVAMEMLNEKKNGGGADVQEEESAEWYSSTVSHLDDSESETEA